MKYLTSICLLVFLCMSCSLDYLEEEQQLEGIPEFVFSDAKSIRFQNGTITAEINAGRLEQYRNDGSMYGRDVLFKTYTSSGILSAEGGCGLLAADASAELYTLVQNISIVSYEQNVTLQTENLKWNGKTEQLVCGENDSVSVTRLQPASPDVSQTEIRLTGRSLSASGISRSYTFAGPVSGTIYFTDAGGGAEGGAL